MDPYMQLEFLTAVVANLSNTGVWSEREVMETLLEVFEPEELAGLGYDERVENYMKEYGVKRNNSINVKNAMWELSSEERYAIDWFGENGFTGTLDKQYMSKTKFTVCKNGITEQFELPSEIGSNIEAYMEQFSHSFDQLCELKRLRAELAARQAE